MSIADVAHSSTFHVGKNVNRLTEYVNYCWSKQTYYSDYK